jgi:hypothetical protein
MQTNIEVASGTNHSLDAFAEMYWGISNLAPKTVQNYRNAYRRNVGVYIGVPQPTNLLPNFNGGSSHISICNLIGIPNERSYFRHKTQEN